MKIYFIDGIIGQEQYEEAGRLGCSTVIDAYEGYEFCITKLDLLKVREHQSGKRISIYTNFICALNNKYVWNEETNSPDLFIKKGAAIIKFKHVCELTDRKIRRGDNLEMMYRNGAFNI